MHMKNSGVNGDRPVERSTARMKNSVRRVGPPKIQNRLRNRQIKPTIAPSRTKLTNTHAHVSTRSEFNRTLIHLAGVNSRDGGQQCGLIIPRMNAVSKVKDSPTRPYIQIDR